MAISQPFNRSIGNAMLTCSIMTAVCRQFDLKVKKVVFSIPPTKLTLCSIITFSSSRSCNAMVARSVDPSLPESAAWSFKPCSARKLNLCSHEMSSYRDHTAATAGFNVSCECVHSFERHGFTRTINTRQTKCLADASRSKINFFSIIA